MRTAAAARPLPSALDVEQLVLGAMLTNTRQDTPLALLLTSLTDADFTIERNRHLFSIISTLVKEGKHVDTATVYQKVVESKGDSTYLLTYLSELTTDFPHIVATESYIGTLREKTRLRSLIVELKSLEEQAFGSEPSDAIFDQLQRLGDKLADKLGGKDETETPMSLVEAVGVNEILTPKKQKGIQPPFAWMRDRFTFAPKSLTILAARPSVGKSALALQIMAEAARHHHRTIFYSLEMHNADQLRRMIGQNGRVNMFRFRNGQSDADDRNRAGEALNYLSSMNDYMLFNDSSHGTIPSIVQHLQSFKLKRKPIDFLIVDYLQLMSPVGRFSNRTEEVSSLSRGLKLIGQLFDISVLALSQLSRESEKEGREPRLSDLRESGSIEQDADAVMFLHRRSPVEDEEQDVRLILAKSRNGPVGRCDLRFTKRWVRFDETTQEAEAA